MTVELEAPSGHDKEQPETTAYCRRSTWNWGGERETERLCLQSGFLCEGQRSREDAGPGPGRRKILSVAKMSSVHQVLCECVS